MLSMSHASSRALRDDRLLAIIRTPTADEAVLRARALIQAGVRALEISLVVDGALDAISATSASAGEGVSVGAGTVMTAREARDAVACGADFLVTPALVEEVSTAADTLGVGYYPGAATPAEIVTAWRSGATAVKVFPAGPLGVDYLRAVREPLPQIPLIAVGGVTAETAADFIAAGAVGVGMGGALVASEVRSLLARLRASAAER